MSEKGSFWPGNNSCGLRFLHINEVCLQVSSLLQVPVDIKYVSTECEECEEVQLPTIMPNGTMKFVLDSNYPLFFRFGNVCNVTKWFDDLGLYYYEIKSDNSTDCGSIAVRSTPEYFWANFFLLALICLSIPILMRLLKFCFQTNFIKRIFQRNSPFEELQSDGPESNNQRNEARSWQLTRVTTIDVFRGISIALMVFVNYGGGQYSVFKHAPWNGLTVADIVFPFFIWIMGVSTVISLRSQLRALVNRKKIFLKILWRTVILVSLGLILNSGKAVNTPLRIPGVLQRIGLTYFFLASVELFFGKPQRSDRYGPWNMCVEVVDAKLQWISIFILTAVHVSVTFLLPIPGCPTGYVGPGGLSHHAQFENCTGGAAGYIDRVVFTSRHIYQHPTSAKVYHSHVPYDPEGLLGVLTSVVMAFFGAQCGRIILSYESSRSRLIRWVFWSVTMGAVAGFLCGWSKSGGVIPINKNLWSLSYVLATSAMAFALFAVLYWLIDDLKLWSGAPFLYAGMNSIAVYLGHELLNKQLPWRWSPFTDTHIELLFMDVSATGIWLLVAYIMFTKNVFFSL